MSKTPSSIVKLIIGLVIFAGLPLIAWGVADLAGFFNQPARSGYMITVVILQLITVIKFPTIGNSARTGVNTVPAQRIALLLLQIIPLTIILGGPASDRHNVFALGASDLIRYLGLIVFASGFGLMQWAEAALGRQFSVEVTLQTNHQRITTGPYRFLRHPRYLGILAYNLGVALIFNSAFALLLSAALLAVLIWRIGTEETMMRQAFGSDWTTYTQRSWRLIPLVY